jgi:tetratricopeptide (TPR) repeat protein
LIGVLWPFWVLAILGFSGMALVLFDKQKRRQLIWLYAIFAGYALTLVAAHVAERYRLALSPILAVFGGYFLFRIWEIIQGLKNKTAPEENVYDIRKYKKLLPIALPLIFISTIPFVSLGQISRTLPSDTWNNLGAEALDEGKTDEAAYCFQKSIEAMPQMPSPHANLGRTYLEEGKMDEAIEELRTAIKLQPDSSADLLKIALEGKKNNASAEEIKKQIKELSKKGKDELFNVDYIEAVKLLREKKYLEALPKLEKAREKNPDNDQILTNIGTAYKNTGDLNKAKESFSLAILNDGYNLPARYNMVNVQRARKENDLAFTQLNIINGLVPGYMLSQMQLAELNLAKGNAEAAKNLYQAFLDDKYNPGLYPDYVPKAREMIAKINTAKTMPAGTASPADAMK